MSKIQYTVTSLSSSPLPVGQFVIPPAVQSYPLSVDEDGPDDLAVKACAVAGKLIVVSSPYLYPGAGSFSP